MGVELPKVPHLEESQPRFSPKLGSTVGHFMQDLEKVRIGRDNIRYNLYPGKTRDHAS